MTHPETYDGPRLTAAIVIPALNEEAVIEDAVVEIHASVDQLATDGHPVDVQQIIVVDNGSTDDTAARAETAGAVVVSEPQRGYGRACATGVLAAGDVDLVILMDGDGSDDPADLTALLAPILDGSADLVVGSRTRGHAAPGSMTAAQVVGNRVATRALRLRYGLRATDIGPFRVIRRDQLLRLGMTEMTYAWSTEMMARAARSGLRLTEVPVNYRVRAGGESKVSGNLRASLRAGERILGAVIRAGRDRPDRTTNPFPPRDADR
jgi:glycosyltransferase involved in cell wall biosynthesis